jgi:hypothetical protein
MITVIPPDSMALLSPELARTYLVRYDGVTEPLLAGFSYTPPEPGWPPTIPTGM